MDSYLILGNYSLGFPSTNKFTHLVSSGSIATIMRYVAKEVLIADSTKLTKVSKLFNQTATARNLSLN